MAPSASRAFCACAARSPSRPATASPPPHSTRATATSRTSPTTASSSPGSALAVFSKTAPPDRARIQAMPETARLGWVIVYVPDVDAALSLYERAFGMTRRFAVDTYGELDTGSTVLAFAAEALGEENFAGGVAPP